jgi:hypothetical protein
LECYSNGLSDYQTDNDMNKKIVIQRMNYTDEILPLTFHQVYLIVGHIRYWHCQRHGALMHRTGRLVLWM